MIYSPTEAVTGQRMPADKNATCRHGPLLAGGELKAWTKTVLQNPRTGPEAPGAGPKPVVEIHHFSDTGNNNQQKFFGFLAL